MARIKMAVQKQEVKTLSQCFEDFIKQCKRKNLSEATIRSYRHHLAKFFQYFGNDTDIAMYAQNTVYDYVSHLQEVLNNPTTINTGLRHLKAFTRFLNEQGYINAVKISFLKVQETAKDCYTEQELRMLLRKPNIKECSFAEYRNWCMVNFLIGTGCRISTLINVRIADIDFDNAFVTFRHTKNKQPQIIPLPQNLISIIQEYLEVRQGTGEDYLFCNDLGTQLHPHSASHAVMAYNRSKGITKTSAHLFRHTFAKNWVMQGGDIFRLQKVLGHQTLQMSQHYSNLYGVEALQNTDSFNLFNKLQSPTKIKVQK